MTGDTVNAFYCKTLP